MYFILKITVEVERSYGQVHRDDWEVSELKSRASQVRCSLPQVGAPLHRAVAETERDGKGCGKATEPKHMATVRRAEARRQPLGPQPRVCPPEHRPHSRALRQLWL